VRAVADNGPLLGVENLSVEFSTEHGLVRVVDGVSFSIGQGETFCLVGESGCGKTVTALAIMRLVQSPPGRIASGRVVFDGEDLVRAPEWRARQVRGAGISMVFQEPMAALNPVFTIGEQVAEGIRAHLEVSRREARRMALEMLRNVRMPEPERRMDEYPHQMSGGMLQRAMIAAALVCRPALLIADEPTTALDVTVQAQILALLKHLQGRMGMSVLLITHDLGVVAQVADRVAVMYAGQIVESADVDSLFARPLHPYMNGLLNSVPVLGSGKRRLNAIPGNVPDPRWLPSGCRFHPRCPMAEDRCAAVEPELRLIEPGHSARCMLLDGYETAARADASGAAEGAPEGLRR